MTASAQNVQTPVETRVASESAPELDPSRPLRLSRYAYLRPGQKGSLLAESLSTGRILPLTNPTQIALIFRFLDAVSPDELLEGLDETRRSALLRFFTTCYDSGLLTPVDDNDRGEDEERLGAHWEPQDLLFHVRSRRGRTPFTVGATYQMADLPPAPALAEPTHPIALQLPKAESTVREPRTLTDVLESRRSRYSTEPVSLEALGELLYRAARITGQNTTQSGEVFLRRVYPSGGSLHPLELYVIPARCPGLARGVYHYRPDSHALARVAGPSPDVDALLEEARKGTGQLDDEPSILLIFSARLRRVARKYSGLSYGLVLKEVGAAFQTLYLVATDMGLAPCALGTGDSDRFALATGRHYFEETSVGEFIVGGPNVEGPSVEGPADESVDES